MTTTQEHIFPAELLKNIVDARLNPPQNHFAVAEQVLTIALSDVNRATRNGSHMITGTRLGNIEVKRTEARGTYRIVNFNTGEALFVGSKPATVKFVACSYVIA